jgi:hypothetical protein
MVEVTGEAVGVITGDMPTATEEAVEAITGDMGGRVILTGGAIPTDGIIIPIGGVILIAGVILTGGLTRIIPTMTLTTILIPMRTMKGRRCFHKELLLRRSRNNNNLLIGTFVRTQRDTTPTLKTA